ncbi:MAG: hemolysin family protein [Planctomycetota bacterium]
MFLLVVAVSLSLLFSFVCSISEATLLSVGPARVEQLAQQPGRLGLILRRFRQEPDRPIAAILIVNTISNSGGAAIATAQFSIACPGVSEAWFAAFFVVTVLAVTEIIPKTMGVVHADALALPITAIVQTMIIAVWPMLFFTRLLARMFARVDGGPTTSLDEIRVMTTVGMTEGSFGRITGELIQNATRLRDLTAKDVMVSRDRINYLSGDQTLEANLKRVQRTGHSRFPFTATGELDDVQGVVLAKELLFDLRQAGDSDDEPDWEGLMIPLLIVPEAATLNHVLRRFQLGKRHMAIVVDEYGSTQGIVTLEDVLEEIVGEIEDESDIADDAILERPDGTLVCQGGAEIADVLQRLKIEGVETDSKTLSGFLAEHLDSVPQAGARVDVGGYRFDVTKANNRRAERVMVTHLPASASSSGDETAAT